MVVLQCFHQYRNNLDKSLSNVHLFGGSHDIVFAAEIPEGVKANHLKIYKTHRRKVYTLHIGEMRIIEELFEDQCHQIYRSNELSKIVAAGSNYGYDVIEFIGMARFISNQTVEQVREQLGQANIPISHRQIGQMEKKFLAYLSLAHHHRSEQIIEFMRANGGYILHIDGTVEGDSPSLFTALDSLSGFVLHTVKIPSEKSECIIGFLSSVLGKYGTPVAVVSDCCEAIHSAIKEVFKGCEIPVLVCHFHFLRDIGKDLLQCDYDDIRKQLKQHKIASKLNKQARRLKQQIDRHPQWIEQFNCAQKHFFDEQTMLEPLEWEPVVIAYVLIQWLLDGKRQAHGYGFPFDQPHLHFARRLLQLREQLEMINWNLLLPKGRKRQAMISLHRSLYVIKNESRLIKSILSCEEKVILFNQLRKAMEIAPLQKGKGLNSQANKFNINKIEKQVARFRRKLAKTTKDSPSQKCCQKMLTQLDKFWERLFADPIEVVTEQGKILIQPQRTNNIMEQFFRGMKRSWRRTTGNKNLNKMLKSIPAEIVYIRNLRNEHYRSILLGHHKSLTELFASIDIKELRQQKQKFEKLSERVPSSIKKLVKSTKLTQLLEFLSLRMPQSTTIQ